MRPILLEVECTDSPESLVEKLHGQAGVILLNGVQYPKTESRYSFVAANPILTFKSKGSACFIDRSGISTQIFGNPWRILEDLMSRFELLEQLDIPFPLGACMGYWGYDLKNFTEPRLPRNAVNDLEVMDCQVGFYDSFAAFDHQLGKTWIISTGLMPDASRSESQAKRKIDEWLGWFGRHSDLPSGDHLQNTGIQVQEIHSTLSAHEFMARVKRAQQYIHAGDIYQVNLSHRLSCKSAIQPWQLFQNLGGVSPAPFSAFMDFGSMQVISSSPELFLQMSGQHILTRPIKGTRPRSSDPARDAQLSYELQTSSKETAELVMITDLLRNDLGRICDYGSIRVPELMRLERYAHVQHLVSTVEGSLRSNVPHFAALASCFPGGSITGAPKIRAMEIIDELEPVSRGLYTGTIGYLGFNRESRLGIAIRTAICEGGNIHFNVGAGIVADSEPQAEYEETLTKARGFFEALKLPLRHEIATRIEVS